MNIQLKQKIIGIIIVAVFLAIAIPFLLSGTKSKNDGTVTEQTTQIDMQQISPATTPEITPTQPVEQPPTSTTQTVDTSTPTATNPESSPSPQPAQEITTPSLSPVPDLPTQAQPNQGDIATSPDDAGNTNTANAGDTATPTVGADSVTASPTTSTPSSSSTPTSPETTAALPPIAQNQNPALAQSLEQKENEIVTGSSHKKNTPKIANAKGKHQVSKVKKSVDKTYLIVLGGYLDDQKAQYLANTLKRGGYHAYTKKGNLKGKNITIVLVGPVKNKLKTEKMAQKIEKNFGIITKIVPKIG